MTDIFHAVYGLRIRTDDPIPGLAEAGERGAFDLDVHLRPGTFPHDRHFWSGATACDEGSYQNGGPAWRMWRLDGGGGFRIRYADGTDFLIDASGTQVWARWDHPMTLEDTATYLLGPILRRVLMLRGVLCLHASAIVLDGRAVALAGPMGSGKSTTAAAFARRGAAVLTDDLVALATRGEEFLVQPGPRLIRLWPDVSEAVSGSPDALPRLTPNWDKRFLPLEAAASSTEPAPLAAIYLFAGASTDRTAPRLTPLSARDALIGLVAESRCAYPLDSSQLGAEYRMLGRLRQSVRIRRLVPHTSLDRLQQLCDVIEEDVHVHAPGRVKGQPASLAGAAP
jgi:hypothetical protein